MGRVSFAPQGAPVLGVRPVIPPVFPPVVPRPQPVDPQPVKRYKVNPYVIFDRKEIRDTATYNSDLPMPALDCVLGLSFIVDNRHNMAVSLQLIGGGTPAHVQAAALLPAIVIAAATREAISISRELWMPYLSLRVSYTTSPTSGDISIDAYAQERIA